ncbi:hemolysin secretion protein D [Synergistales bacterium]|nr:hemolysin secretion protein D [Synergistales bacterium]GHV53895.1 hemolysin secretion protein D [Synergistales bacterium]
MSKRNNEPKELKQTDFREKKSFRSLLTAAAVLVAAAIFVVPYLAAKKPYMRAEADAQQAPLVVLQVVALADLSHTSEYVGRVEAIQSVSVKPQVAGEITRVHFREGSVVRAGQPLFSIDGSQYSATVELRRAALASATAARDNAVKYLARLNASDKRSVSEADRDSAENAVRQAEASVAQSRASLKLAEIDLAHASIRSPITGRVGKAAYTKGNYVTPAGGALADIVQVDPVRVAFAMPDKEYIAHSGKRAGASYDMKLRLADGSEYPVRGEPDFEDNVMNSSTGTIAVAFRFANEDGQLVPGEMVRVSMSAAERSVAPVIPQEALMTDAKGDYVYTVDGSDTVKETRVELGGEYGTMTEVRSGLDGGEKVIVSGLQSARAGSPVKVLETKDPALQLKTPAQAAMESGYDPKIISSADVADKAK